MSGSTIQVVGVGEASAPPDSARVSLTVSAERGDVSAALAAAAEAVGLVTDAVRNAGLGDADIRTSNVQVYPAYDNTGQPTGQQRAAHNLSLRVLDLASVGDVVAQAAATGSQVAVDSLMLTIADSTGLEDAAREAAFDDARRRARQLAALAGLTLGDVVGVDEGSSGGGAPRAMMAKRESMSIEPGEQSVVVNLSVSFGAS